MLLPSLHSKSVLYLDSLWKECVRCAYLDIEAVRVELLVAVDEAQ
jgi:hypothetical protein